MSNVEFVSSKSVMKHSLVVLLVPLVALSVVTQLYLLLPVVDIMNHFLGTKSSLTGLLTSAFGGFYAVGFLVWGFLSDKFGRVKIIVSGLFALAAVTALIAFQSDFHSILALRCIQGFIASSFPPVVLAWVAENFQERLKKFLISLLSCSFLLAGTLGQLYGSLMVSESLEKAMLLLCIMYCVGAICFSMWADKGKKMQIPGKKNHAGLALKTLLSTLSDRSLSRIYLASLFVLMSFVSFYYITLSHIRTDALANIDINILRNTATLGMMACLFSGFIFQHIQPAKLLSIMLLVIAITVPVQYALSIAEGSWFFPVVILHFIFSCAVSLAVPAMIYCVALFSDQTNRGVAVSLYTCILFIGASLGSLIPTVIKPVYFIALLTSGLLLASFSVAKKVSHK
ncbi:TPA: MFS transporter [Klebsiella oxytoca]|nr:MFS transporter [Klebsiella oxytoca]